MRTKPRVCPNERLTPPYTPDVRGRIWWQEMTLKTYPNKLSVDVRDLDILDDNVIAIGDLQTFTFAGSKDETSIENCRMSY